MPAPDTYYPDNLARIAQIRGAVSKYDDGTNLIARLNRGEISLEEAALTCGADTHMPAGNLLQRIWDLESAENREAFIENTSNWVPDMLQRIWDLETPENRAAFLVNNGLTTA